MTVRILLALSLLCPALWTHAEVPAPVLEKLRAADLPEDSIGIVVRRASDGTAFLLHQPDRPMQPGSTLKLLTALVALETLGPGYRGRTYLLTDGEIEAGVLKGDLVLRGTGDVDFDVAAFEQVLRVARLQGIREIRGDFVLDRTFFVPGRTDIGLPPFDETPEFRYNVVPDALLVDTNLVRVDMASDEKGVRAELFPALEGVTVRNEFTLGDRACKDWEEGWLLPKVERGRRGALEIVLRGEFPRRCVVSTSINVIERFDWVSRLFRTTWKRLGGTIRGDVKEGTAPAAARVLADHRSRILSEVIFDVEKRSDNPNTRIVYLALGANAKTEGEPATAKRAERVVRAWMEKKGIDATGLVLENGSGLSRIEKVRPSQLADVVARAQTSPWGPEFTAALPLVGIDVMTRLSKSPVAGRARLKTGTLRDASAIAGYLKDDADETWILVAIVNHPRANPEVARPILDSVIEWLYTSRERGSSRP
jgi:D-alanyl-D-alanine carboxypeptidase/D-alanyl-D-alanine-endopeptidase (penicillin-binding protein 4)